MKVESYFLLRFREMKRKQYFFSLRTDMGLLLWVQTETWDMGFVILGSYVGTLTQFFSAQKKKRHSFVYYFGLVTEGLSKRAVVLKKKASAQFCLLLWFCCLDVYTIDTLFRGPRSGVVAGEQWLYPARPCSTPQWSEYWVFSHPGIVCHFPCERRLLVVLQCAHCRKGFALVVLGSLWLVYVVYLVCVLGVCVCVVCV